RHTSFSRDWSSDVCSSDLFYILSLTHFLNGLIIDRFYLYKLADLARKYLVTAKYVLAPEIKIPNPKTMAKIIANSNQSRKKTSSGTCFCANCKVRINSKIAIKAPINPWAIPYNIYGLRIKPLVAPINCILLIKKR